jgi:hypothetical protein
VFAVILVFLPSLALLIIFPAFLEILPVALVVANAFAGFATTLVGDIDIPCRALFEGRGLEKSYLKRAGLNNKNGLAAAVIARALP